jgi:hypothetical protein
MTKKQLRALAEKLHTAYRKVYSLRVGIALVTFADSRVAVQDSWIAAAKIATRELTNHPKSIRCRAAKPKACKLNAHGKWECTP